MRNNVLTVRYAKSGEYRYEICQRTDGTYGVWVQQKITDAYMGTDWFDYHDIRDYCHIADSLIHAVEIAEECLFNLSGEV